MNLKEIKRWVKIKACSISTRFFTLDTITLVLQLKLVRKQFLFDGNKLSYIFHSHNNMGLTERTCELSIARHYLEKYKPKNLLEIGNVTIYYYNFFKGLYDKRTAVDLGEIDYYVISKDIATFSSQSKFDFIMSISTFEHMDEAEFKPQHFNSTETTVAAQNIIYCYENLLQEEGVFLITAALGWTKEWDVTFKSDLLDNYPFKNIRKFLMRRVSEQEWIEVEDIKTEKTPYGVPFNFGNWLSVVEIKK